MEYQIKIYDDDIGYNYVLRAISSRVNICIDTETTGLNPLNSKLSLIQIKIGNQVLLIRFKKGKRYDNLNLLFSSDQNNKIFHNATFDIKFLMQNIPDFQINHVICTKIAYKLLYGTTQNSSLKLLLKKYLDVNISKTQRLSNWERLNYTQAQVNYAVNDILYLEDLWKALWTELSNRGLIDFAEHCFSFVPFQARLELNGINNIFKY